MIKDELLISTGGIVKRAIEIFSELELNDIYEIRIRNNRPIVFRSFNKEIFIDKNFNKILDYKKGLIIKNDDIYKTVELMSRYSLYAFDEDLRKGFITIKGGHRAGILGKVVLENNKIKTLTNISSINIRISHQIKGCSKKVIPYITTNKNEIYNTMIISPPGYGKTTILRDIIMNLSNGTDNGFFGKNVCVIDERSEICGSFLGECRNDIGIRTDVLDSCPKAEGIELILRSMSPEIIAVDEIGKEDDILALMNAFNNGVSIICTIHGKNIDDIYSKKSLNKIMESRYFDRYIVLGKMGQELKIYENNGNVIYKG